MAGSIAGLGVAQIAITGITLEALPGPILLWIAWDIYHRVAKEPRFSGRSGRNRPEYTGRNASRRPAAGMNRLLDRRVRVLGALGLAALTFALAMPRSIGTVASCWPGTWVSFVVNAISDAL